MPTPERETAGAGSAAKKIAQHASAIARLETQLAVTEVKEKLVGLGIGVGYAAGAAIFLLFVIGFAAATAAAGLSTTLSTWLALLIVTGVLLVVAVTLGLLARAVFKKAPPLVPEAAIEEARLTTEAVMNGSRQG
jgi:hypothetical protein